MLRKLDQYLELCNVLERITGRTTILTQKHMDKLAPTACSSKTRLIQCFIWDKIGGNCPPTMVTMVTHLIYLSILHTCT